MNKIYICAIKPKYGEWIIIPLKHNPIEKIPFDFDLDDIKLLEIRDKPDHKDRSFFDQNG